MNKSLLIALGIAFASASTLAFAYDNGHNYRYGYVSRSDRLDYRFSQVDRQLDRVRFQLRNSRGDYRLQRDFGMLSRRFERVKSQYRSGGVDRYRVSRELDQIRADLDRIQDRLSYRDRDDRWNR